MMVMIIPPGSFPGMIHLARMPAIRPKRIQPRMAMALLLENGAEHPADHARLFLPADGLNAWLQELIPALVVGTVAFARGRLQCFVGPVAQGNVLFRPHHPHEGLGGLRLVISSQRP